MKAQYEVVTEAVYSQTDKSVISLTITAERPFLARGCYLSLIVAHSIHIFLNELDSNSSPKDTLALGAVYLVPRVGVRGGRTVLASLLLTLIHDCLERQHT